MSDLQIITGLSILISGFKQLYDGLSTYHWMAIICLAWFSNVTHLACLTLLRNYLYNHPIERVWRLLSMAALAILLLTALSFTGDYEWTSAEWNKKSPSILLVTIDPAMCHLGTRSRSSYSYYAMIVSMVLIIFGFVARILKLFKPISIGICGRIRSWLSIRAHSLLRVAYDRLCSKCSSHSLKRSLLYRPLLTIFLIGQLFLESWSSTSLEVSAMNSRSLKLWLTGNRLVGFSQDLDGVLCV